MPPSVHSTSMSQAARIGRPSKLDEHGVPTRERLLDAAVDVCVESGYEGATLTEIARRAQVSTPAIYSHFADKAALMVAASQRQLERVSSANAEVSSSVLDTVERWIDPDRAALRHFVVELHMAAARHDDLRTLLSAWHRENAATSTERNGRPLPQVKLLYLLLMGLAHIDEIDLGVSDPDFRNELERLITGWLAA